MNAPLPKPTRQRILPRRVRRWRQAQPHSGGLWLWREHLEGYSTELLLTDCGGYVAYDDEAKEGSSQYYWEGTATTQKEMPGYWRQQALPNK